MTNHTREEKKINKVFFSHKSDELETPQELFDALDAEFGFRCDVAATRENKKCGVWIGADEDAIEASWMNVNWCNPPYSRVKEFARKASEEANKGKTTVMLIPARTDTAFFHDYIYKKPNVEVRFLRGRLKFISPDGSLLRKGASNSAPFPSMVVIFKANP